MANAFLTPLLDAPVPMFHTVEGQNKVKYQKEIILSPIFENKLDNVVLYKKPQKSNPLFTTRSYVLSENSYSEFFQAVNQKAVELKNYEDKYNAFPIREENTTHYLESISFDPTQPTPQFKRAFSVIKFEDLYAELLSASREYIIDNGVGTPKDFNLLVYKNFIEAIELFKEEMNSCEHKQSYFGQLSYLEQEAKTLHDLIVDPANAKKLIASYGLHIETKFTKGVNADKTQPWKRDSKLTVLTALEIKELLDSNYTAWSSKEKKVVNYSGLLNGIQLMALSMPKEIDAIQSLPPAVRGNDMWLPCHSPRTASDIIDLLLQDGIISKQVEKKTNETTTAIPTSNQSFTEPVKAAPTSTDSTETELQDEDDIPF